MKPYVYLFTYGGVLPETMDCLIAEMREWPFAFQQCWNAAALDRNRSLYASRFLETDGDVFVSIDHDTQWYPGAVAKLAKAAYDSESVVGGVYSKRAFGRGLAIRPLEPGAFTIPSDELVPVKWVAGGFLAAHRKVLEKVGETLPNCVSADNALKPFFLPYIHENEYLTEDYAFCQRAKEAGFEVYADLSIALTHVGTHGFRVVDGLSRLPDNGEVTVTWK